MLRPEGMAGAYLYQDALLDDSRMVLRLIQEACEAGGAALNYARVAELLRTKKVMSAVWQWKINPERKWARLS